jgi:outer membrane protein OmpA-like peptidoglycan-associated protein
MKKLSLSLILLTTMMIGQVQAQPQPLSSATTDQLEQQLAPSQVKTRGLRNLAPQAQSVDLVIQFDFDSARLQEASKSLLNNLAAAMKRDRLKEVNFRVEGHTDAKGKPEYNMQLSERRAAAVVTYLQSQGVEEARLNVQGKGATELLLPDQPLAMENRRVRVVALP